MFDGTDNDLDIQFDFDDEDDDMLLAGAVDDASMLSIDVDGEIAGPNKNDEDLANISLGIENTAITQTQNCDISGFDRSAGQLWIYPTNYPIRDYQYNIVQQALHRNTLVVLPTGLGKTFIAAVVMYNMYRWFPQGKVVFMAPTKPLVAQQIHACYTIVGIPKEDTIEMTGNMNPVERERMWRQKRVIFLTPQVMTNDLSRGSFSATTIKCLVVDEAHKAVGNHSYCQVVQGLLNFTQEFRVLALSATPGSDLKGVQKVMCNLLIAHIELRSEESIDIRPYTHERKVDKIVVPMGEELSGIRLKYIQVMELVVNRLIKQRVLYNRDATKLSKFLILKARDEFRQNPPSHIQGPQYGTVEGDFATAMSLYHGFELLQLHGLRSLYNFLLGIQSGEKGYGRTRYELCRNPDFIDIMEQLQEKFALKKLNGPGQDKDAKMVVGHPKMQRLEEIVVEHFKSFQEKNLDTRVMIFSQYRDSVEEIRNILNQHQPLVKVMMFIGQSSVGKTTKGYTQKEQLQVMKRFREGGYNTLVSTCVGEEGLDIGDVDLIVCFDAHKSPIRLVQRMGRTGRKREGRIVMLVTKGKEEQIYNKSLYSKKSVHKAIVNGAKTLHFYPHNPPLIPADIKPKCHKMHITVKPPECTNKKSKKSTSDKAGAKKAMSNGSDISVAFGKARSKQSSSELSHAEYEEIREEFCQISKTAKHVPKPQCTVLTKNNELEEDSNDRAMMTLSEWTPWQNRVQSTHFIGHSSTTHNLVQTCQFIELQQSIGEEANSYELEMELYLKKDDVEKSSSSLNQSVFNLSGQSTIKSFFLPSQGMKRADQSSAIDNDRDGAGSFKKKSDPAVKKMKKGKRKGKKDGNANVDIVNPERAACNSSGLFTTIKSVVEKKDNEFEIIDDEMDGGLSVDLMLQTDTTDVTSRVRKKKGTKKKLLNKKDAVWKDQTNWKLRSCVGEKKNQVSKIFNLEATLGTSSYVRDLEADSGDDCMNWSDKDSSCNKPLSDNKKGNQSSLFTRLSAKDDPAKLDCYVDDVIDVEDTVQEITQKNDKLHRAECINKICLIPSPPRVEEVAEIFESNNQIDFASVDIYQFVNEFKKLEESLKSLNLPVASSMSTNFLSVKKSFVIDEHDPCYLDNMNPELERVDNVLLPEKAESLLYNEDCKTGVITLSDEEKSLSLSEYENHARKSKEESDKINDIENGNAFSVSCQDKCEKSLSPTFTADERYSHNDPNQSVLATTEIQPSLDMNLIINSPHNVDHEPNALKVESCKTSRVDFIDSIDDIMGAIDSDSHMFSPTQVKKGASQGKLGDYSSRNISANNISLATFSQALDCLHSSSSDNLSLSENSTSKKNSLNLSAIGGKRIKKSPEAGFTHLKQTQISVLLTEEETVPPEIFSSSPVFENSVSNNNNFREVIKDYIKTENFSSTPCKLAAISEYESDDNLCVSDIIPPTPTKDISCRSAIAIGTSQSNQNNCNNLRDTKAVDLKEQARSIEKCEKIAITLDKCQKDIPTTPTNNSKNLQSMEITNIQREEKHSCSFQNPSQNYSSNEENYPIPFQQYNIADISAQDIEDGDDCIIVTSPTRKQKFPLASHENTDYIEILDSQTYQQLLHSPPHDPFSLLKSSPPRTEAPQIKTMCDTPTTSRSGAKSFLSTSTKKRLSLKSSDMNYFHNTNHVSIAKDNDQLVIRQEDMDKSLMKPNLRQISASTPVAKGLVSHLKEQSLGDHDNDDIDSILDMDHLTPIKGLTSTPQNEDADIEKSFFIKRKRKPPAILDSSSDNDSSTGRKNNWLSAKGMPHQDSHHIQNQSKDLKKDKSRSFEEWQASCLDDIEDNDDDFEEMEPVFSKGKKSPAFVTKAQRKYKGGKRPKKNAGFVEKEADVSDDDGSSDEEEHDEDDYYEESFINNDTEMTQTQADVTDMRAVYLKSVKSPLHGKYRLQFNHGHHTDIYSQALTESQGNSEYEEDSFCVGSEEQESDSPVKKKSKKRDKNGNEKEGKKNKKRRVVCMISDSSSDDDDGDRIPFTQEFTTNQRTLAQKALVSSSEDEEVKQKQSNSPDDKDVFEDNYLFCQSENKSSPIPAAGKSKNWIPQQSNSNALSTLPLCVTNSVLQPNITSKSENSSINSINQNVDIPYIDEWMDDFNDVNIDNDLTDITVPQKNKEVAQSINYAEQNEASEIIIKKSKCFDNSQKAPSNISSTMQSIDHNRQHISPSLHPETIITTGTSAFVKPLENFSEKKSSKTGDCVNRLSYSKESYKSAEVSRDIAREERLKRQKEKQDRFRQKLAQVQQQKQSNDETESKIDTDTPVKTQAATAFVHPLSVTSLTHSSKSSPSSVRHQSVTETSIMTHPSPSISVTHVESPSTTSNISANASTIGGTEALQILVDTREISGAQDVISALRLKHSVTVTAKQLSSCDYVLSNHLVVDRLYWSAFSNGTHRSRLIARLSEMQTLYRKCAMIIEADKVKLKTGQEKNRKFTSPHSKYLDRTMACLVQTGVKMYFTDSSEQTASLLSELCQAEKRKGRHLTVPTKLNPKKEGMYNFVMSIPQINVMEALNLVHRYNNLAEIVSSPAAVLQKKGCLSSEKVQWVYSYLRHRFDPQMLPASYR